MADFTPDPKFTSEFPDLTDCALETTGYNPYFPLLPGYVIVLESDEELVEVVVTEEIEVVDGVPTRIVLENEFEILEDGSLLVLEISYNFFTYCPDSGAVYYHGEDVDIYNYDDLGNLIEITHEGEWRAGPDAMPGQIMPGPGGIFRKNRFYQEIAPEAEALDKGKIHKMYEECEVNDMDFENCIEVIDSSDCSPEKDRKIYGEGIGILQDEDLEITFWGFP